MYSSQNQEHKVKQPKAATQLSKAAKSRNTINVKLSKARSQKNSQSKITVKQPKARTQLRQLKARTQLK